MTDTILLIGSQGSMGTRYQAILRALGVRYRGVDPVTAEPPAWVTVEMARYCARAERIRGIIIASPTVTHAGYIRALALLGKPILCEKPLSITLAEVDELLRAPCPLDMMSQYVLLDPARGNADDPACFTSYDYYHSGNDGLAWDCCQLLGLARGSVSLKAESPTWRCVLNGRRLSLEEVGQAYVDYVARWLMHPEGDRALIRRMHERAAAWRAECRNIG